MSLQIAQHRLFLAAVLIIAVFAVWLRLRDIGFEAIWLDEACTIIITDGGPATALHFSARDSTPPLYFLGLVGWRALTPGTDGWMRGFSALWSLAGAALLFGFALRAGGRRAALAALLLVAVNPLDIVFAQELRMYSQAAALATAAWWCLWEWLRAEDRQARAAWWILYAVCSWALLMTHYVGIAVLLAQGCWALWLLGRAGDWRRAAHYAGAGLAVAALFLPWYAVVHAALGGFNTGNIGWMKLPPWYYYANFLWLEFFWGHVAPNHGRFWWISLPLSLAALAWYARASRQRPADGAASAATEPPVLWMLGGPVLVALVLNYAYRPVYARERFALFVLPGFLLAVALAAARTRRTRAAAAALCVLGGAMLWGSVVQGNTRQKIDWREFGRIWNTQGPPAAVAFFPFYLNAPVSHVLGRVTNSIPMKELGGLRDKPDGRPVWALVMPSYRTGAPPAEQEYYRAVHGLGVARTLVRMEGLEIREIIPGRFPVPDEHKGRFDRWFEPVETPGLVEGFEESNRFDGLEKDADGREFRWSRPVASLHLPFADRMTTVVVCLEMPPPVPSGYQPDLAISLERQTPGQDPDSGEGVTELRVGKYTQGQVEAVMPVPQGPGELVLRWTIRGVNLKREGVSNDNRDLGLKIRWIAGAGPRG